MIENEKKNFIPFIPLTSSNIVISSCFLLIKNLKNEKNIYTYKYL